MKHVRKWLGLEKIQEITFTELVKLQYAFLEEEFGFSISIHKGGNDWGEPFADGVVVFQNSETIVTLDLDRDGSLYIFLGSSNASVPSIYYQADLASVVNLLSHGKDHYVYKLMHKQGEKRRQWTERLIIEEAKVLRKYSHQIFDKKSFEWLDLIKDNKKQAEILYQSTPNKELSKKQN